MPPDLKAARLKKPQWKDETSYQRGEARDPKTWKMEIDLLCLVVTRHIHFAKDAWVFSFRPFYEMHQLKSKDIKEAKAEALRLAIGKLGEHYYAIRDLHLESKESV